MAYIQPNKLMPKTSRVIRPFQCAFISTEGPNILGKLNMSGVEIPYDSQYTTRITLNPGAKKQPLLYGFLGKYVTFVLLKFTYDETNPLCNIEEENFVEYYFEDQPSVKRVAGKLLLLTGNSIYKIPQIYLENPGSIKVTVDALVADINQPDVNMDDAKFTTIDNLYHCNVTSDFIPYAEGITGSTQLQIINTDGYVQLYLDYVDILTVEPRYETNELKITTVSDSIIMLGFLSLFEMYQAYSRINWVWNTLLSNERYLTNDCSNPDITPPVFYQYSYLTPDVLPNTYNYQFEIGDVITPFDLVEYFIESVIDDRDGDIPLEMVQSTLRKYGEIEPIESITTFGKYTILMSAYDTAGNKSSRNYILQVNDYSIFDDSFDDSFN